ncbi:hypothetical protein [Colwellia sp. Bg11-28]|nr:hypothetical protein [Colwellia sp. Bg11-28]
MQVTAKVTETTTISAAELATIGSFFSGLGAVVLAIVTIYAVYRWKALKKKLIN